MFLNCLIFVGVMSSLYFGLGSTVVLEMPIVEKPQGLGIELLTQEQADRIKRSGMYGGVPLRIAFTNHLPIDPEEFDEDRTNIKLVRKDIDFWAVISGSDGRGLALFPDDSTTYSTLSDFLREKREETQTYAMLQGRSLKTNPEYSYFVCN